MKFLLSRYSDILSMIIGYNIWHFINVVSEYDTVSNLLCFVVAVVKDCDKVELVVLCSSPNYTRQHPVAKEDINFLSHSRVNISTNPEKSALKIISLSLASSLPFCETNKRKYLRFMCVLFIPADDDHQCWVRAELLMKLVMSVLARPGQDSSKWKQKLRGLTQLLTTQTFYIFIFPATA